jgi:hypothetical protein
LSQIISPSGPDAMLRKPHSRQSQAFTMSSTFFIPAVNMMGAGSLDEAMVAIANYGFRKR